MDSPMELTPDFMEAEEEPESVAPESELAPESVTPESELAPEPPQHVLLVKQNKHAQSKSKEAMKQVSKFTDIYKGIGFFFWLHYWNVQVKPCIGFFF